MSPILPGNIYCIISEFRRRKINQLFLRIILIRYHYLCLIMVLILDGMVTLRKSRRGAVMFATKEPTAPRIYSGLRIRIRMFLNAGSKSGISLRVGFGSYFFFQWRIRKKLRVNFIISLLGRIHKKKDFLVYGRILIRIRVPFRKSDSDPVFLQGWNRIRATPPGSTSLQ